MGRICDSSLFYIIGERTVFYSDLWSSKRSMNILSVIPASEFFLHVYIVDTFFAHSCKFYIRTFKSKLLLLFNWRSMYVTEKKEKLLAYVESLVFTLH